MEWQASGDDSDVYADDEAEKGNIENLVDDTVTHTDISFYHQFRPSTPILNIHPIVGTHPDIISDEEFSENAYDGSFIENSSRDRFETKKKKASN